MQAFEGEPPGAPRGGAPRRRKLPPTSAWLVPFALFLVGFFLLAFAPRWNLSSLAGAILKICAALACLGGLVVAMRMRQKSLEQ